MMDTRQHSGGALLLNSLDFSPQSALSNENLFLLDPHLSSSPSMDFGGLNPTFSSQLVSDYSPSFLESTSQNSFGLTMGSSTDCTPGQSQASNGFLLPADEWSGTTNSASGANSLQQQQGPQSSSPNQDQSFSSHGSLAQPVVVDPKSSERRYERYLPAASQAGQDACRVQLPIGKSLDCSGDFISGQGHFQATMKQSSLQGSLLGSQLLLRPRQRAEFQNQFSSADFQDGFICQKSNCEGAISTSVPDLSSQDASFQEAWSSVQPVGMECSEADNDQRVVECTQNTGPCTPQPNVLASVIQAKEADNSANRYVSNQEALLQAGPRKNVLEEPTTGTHVLAQQTDQGPQAMRGNALQLHGNLPQSSLQAQLPKQYMNFLAHSATGIQSPSVYSQHSLLQAQGTPDQFSSLQSHASMKDISLSALLQSQSPAQLQSLNRSQLQAHVQAQAANQQAAVTQQAIFQARQMQGGSQQPLFHGNQHGSFHPAHTKDVHSASYNLHLSGAQQMIAQMQPKLLNPIFQGLKAGGQQLLQRSLAGAPSAFGNVVEGRNPVPVAIASRCIQVLMSYIQKQRKRPADNDILFWRNLVKDYFMPGATKRWCLSSYNSSPMGRHAQGLFPMDYWFCNLCGVHPGRGFESSTDVLPRLFRIKYASGLMDELLFLDMAEEIFMLPTGRLILEFPRAVHESIFPELRVVRYGRLRITFSSSFKICSWEFCTKLHEEVVPRKNLLQQGQQLAKLVLDTEQEGLDKNAENLKSQCNEFTSTARQLATKLEAPNVNDLGFSKRYVRCLQIAEVVNSMKDLIAFERKTGLGPIASLNRFPTVRKMQSEGLLSPSTLSQLINQLTQGSRSVNSSYSHARTSVQGQVGSHLQSAVPQGADLAMSKLVNQVPTLVRTQLEPHSDGFLNLQPVGQMQPPAVRAQSQSCNQFLTNSSGQSVVTQQGEPYGRAQPQILSQISGHQTINFNQLAQQIYESARSKQILQQPSNQLLSQSQALTQAGQPCLPDTPQSEMSDIKSNT